MREDIPSSLLSSASDYQLSAMVRQARLQVDGGAHMAGKTKGPSSDYITGTVKNCDYKFADVATWKTKLDNAAYHFRPPEHFSD